MALELAVKLAGDKSLHDVGFRLLEYKSSISVVMGDGSILRVKPT